MPLIDQDGNHTDEVRIPVFADIREILVQHDEVHLLDEEGEPLVIVDHPRHPGAGLGVEIADGVAARHQRRR